MQLSQQWGKALLPEPDPIHRIDLVTKFNFHLWKEETKQKEGECL